MLTTLWHWWIAGLSAPWPRAIRDRLHPRRRHVWVDQNGGGLELVTRRGDAWRTLWQAAGEQPLPARKRRQLRSARVVLRLPGDCALERTVRVPAGTPAQAYVEARLDALTPFPTEQACFDVLEDEDGPDARLVVTRKAEVDTRLQRLRDTGVQAEAVTVAGYEHTPLNLLPAGRAPPARARADMPGAMLLLAGALACAVAVYLPFRDQQRTIEALDVERTRLEQQLARAEETRERLRGLQGRAAIIAEHESSRPDVLSLLAGVTGAVPDHSWVRQWVLHEGSLTLHGESVDTADLIARLEASPLLRNVRYDSAITRDSESGRDRFKLTADTGDDGS